MGNSKLLSLTCMHDCLQERMPLLYQCEVLCDLYESFHAQTSNNIWVVLWGLFIYSCAKFAYLSFAPIDIYKLV